MFATLQAASDKVRTEGWVFKKGGQKGHRRNWNERYFKLSGGGLAYFAADWETVTSSSRFSTSSRTTRAVMTLVVEAIGSSSSTFSPPSLSPVSASTSVQARATASGGC